jgi:hypothetical protein
VAGLGRRVGCASWPLAATGRGQGRGREKDGAARRVGLGACITLNFKV